MKYFIYLIHTGTVINRSTKNSSITYVLFIFTLIKKLKQMLIEINTLLLHLHIIM